MLGPLLVISNILWWMALGSAFFCENSNTYWHSEGVGGKGELIKREIGQILDHVLLGGEEGILLLSFRSTSNYGIFDLLFFPLSSWYQ